MSDSGARDIDVTRERILDAASGLIDREPSGFTIDRVATEAGVSRATLYRRFAGSERLLEALEAERGVTAAARQVSNRSRILDSARTAFAEEGVSGASIQDIADRAGVSQMTVYNHFGDREGLLTALIREQGPASLLPELKADDGPPELTLERFVRRALERAKSKRDLFKLLVSADPVLRRAFNAVKSGRGGVEQELGGFLLRTGLLPAGVQPEVAVAALMGMIAANGFLLPIVTGEEVGTPDELAPQITRIFLGRFAEERET